MTLPRDKVAAVHTGMGAIMRLVLDGSDISLLHALRLARSAEQALGRALNASPASEAQSGVRS